MDLRISTSPWMMMNISLPSSFSLKMTRPLVEESDVLLEGALVDLHARHCSFSSRSRSASAAARSSGAASRSRHVSHAARE